VVRPGDGVLFCVLLLPAFFIALISAGIATAVGGISSMAAFWLLWPLLAAAFLLIVWVVRGAERLARIRFPGLRFVLALAVMAFATFAVVTVHNDNQRCINKQDMTVVAAAGCQNAGNQVNPGPDVWYYDGTGTQIGDSVRGGSLTPPEDEGGGGGSGGGSGGNSGGDDGDDSGSSGGGDDG
jgi:uncharacterized membrane protein YgcG